ncbi:alpha/beta hydrolase-fold protein [Microbulbifer sp. 2201CG32-9]|uniref:alpha/beta hydrolase-fold protein n=1 Tax=Microbulbifer sp. 2201CG32-9 TaxID=3232309 RepID=UPI00345BFB2B
MFLISSVADVAQAIASDVPTITAKKALSYAQEVNFNSAFLDSDISLNIYLPGNFYEASKHQRYPVIFINGIHGREFFLTLTRIVKHLSSVERMPESIVVSLNDGGPMPDIYLNGMWAHTDVEKFESEGDSSAYINFLKDELFPYLEREYRALDNRMIIGISTSSLFPLYTFFHTPELFQSHVFLAAADMLGMGLSPDKRFIDKIAYSMQKNPTRNANFYLGIADSDIAKNERYSTILNKARILLRPYTEHNLKLKIEVIENEGHYDAFIKAMLSALELIYPRRKWSPQYRDLIAQPGDAMQNIDNFYATLSGEYGFSILPRATRWRSVNKLSHITTMLLRENRSQEAISVALRWVEYRPNSIIAYRQLAKAYASNGDSHNAISVFKKALDLAVLFNKSQVDAIKHNLNELEEQVSGKVDTPPN